MTATIARMETGGRSAGSITAAVMSASPPLVRSLCKHAAGEEFALRSEASGVAARHRATTRVVQLDFCALRSRQLEAHRRAGADARNGLAQVAVFYRPGTALHVIEFFHRGVRNTRTDAPEVRLKRAVGIVVNLPTKRGAVIFFVRRRAVDETFGATQ